MKDNRNNFEEFVKQKKIYYDLLNNAVGVDPTELIEKQKNQKSKVSHLVCGLLYDGRASATMKIVYDLGIEKYRTIGTRGLNIRTFDKVQSVKSILMKTYKEFMPKNWVDHIPSKDLIFNPHKPLIYDDDGIECANLFVKNKFLSFNPHGKRIDFIEWEKFPNIQALFENVFKSMDRMNYFVNWVAYGLQTLEKAGTAVISKGTQGTGKGVIWEQIIQYAVGEKYTTLLENEALKSRFNGELENKIFILANEIKADFREGNNSYERLKMYVTDSEIRFEEKNQKARTIPNFFNIWFHSNNDVPLQIQGSDRRYTVFNTKSKKLTAVSESKGYVHISDYIEAIKKERDDFIYQIMSLKYDKYQATTPLSTDEKELIYEASMSKIEVLSDKLKKRDINYFQDVIEDAYESKEIQVVSMDLSTMGIKDSVGLVHEIQKQMNGNYLKNDMSRILYKMFVNGNETDRKIGLQFNKHFGKAYLKNLGGDRFKYREIDSDKSVEFSVNIPYIDEEPNGKATIRNHVINQKEELF